MNNDLEVAHPQSGSSSTWFLVELEFGNVGFWGEGKTGVPGENPFRAKERTNNKLKPHMESTPKFEPGPHWWEANALTTAPSLAPRYEENRLITSGKLLWAQLFEGRLALNPRLNLTRVSFYCVQKHFLG